MSQKLSSAVTREGAAIGTISATTEAIRRIRAGETLSVTQARHADVAEVGGVQDDLRRLVDTLAERYARKARRAGGGPDGVMAILRDSATYRGRTRFDDSSAMAPLVGEIRESMKIGRKLVFVLPVGGGKVPNPAKTGSHYLPDATEWVALARLAAICVAIERIYEPGARIVTLPDAPLHTGDLGFSYPDGAAHASQLNHDLEALGISKYVLVANTTDHLPAGWSREVLRRSTQAKERLLNDSDFARDVDAQVQSLLFSINLRAFSWKYEHVAMVNAALASPEGGFPREVLSDAADIYHQTRRVVPHYIGVNHALRSLDIPARVARDLTGDPTYLRLTVHAKAGEPRPMLTQESRLARPGLLPMHGLALRYESKGRARYSGLFELEARVHGLRPVIETATGRFLFYEPVGGPEAIDSLIPRATA